MSYTASGIETDRRMIFASAGSPRSTTRERPRGHRGNGVPAAAPLAVAAVTAVLLLLPGQALAAVGEETQFVLNSFSFLIWGALVMWMCAGFTMLESGSVRTKNASVICLKNIGLYSIAGLMFYLVGYNIMYVGVPEGGWFGTLTLFYGNLRRGDEAAGRRGRRGEGGGGRSRRRQRLFHDVRLVLPDGVRGHHRIHRVRHAGRAGEALVLASCSSPCSRPSSIRSSGPGPGAADGSARWDSRTSRARRSWHSTGGWAALAGALVVGARKGKFREDGSVKSTPPSNVPAVTLGVFILWLGWFGFNGGSQLALSGAADAVALSNILANTNLAAAAGVIAAMALSRPVLGRVDLLASLNGAIGGLVAITAGPDIVDHYWAVVIGGVGGAIIVLGMKLLDRLKIDDVVGAIPAHLFAGVWGTLAACIAAGGDLGVQIVGILAIGAFVFVTSWVVWWVIDKTIGARVTPVTEDLGQDVAELGIEAYPEFVVMPDMDD